MSAGLNTTKFHPRAFRAMFGLEDTFAIAD